MGESNLGYLHILPRFQYIAPNTVEEVCSHLSQHKTKTRLLAGGTDLLVEMKKRKGPKPEYLISIKNIPELDYIRYDDKDGLRIGASTTLHSVASSPVVNDKFGLLAEACRKVGTPQVRNMGTVAGNVCQAGPSQDTIAPLLALEAKLRLVSSDGERTVPIDEFLLGPFQSVLKDNELLTEIKVPQQPAKSAGCYKWLTKHTVVDETLVGVAVLIISDSTGELCQDVKIGLTSVAPRCIRARQTEEVMRGQKIDDRLVEDAAQKVSEECVPRSRAEYRRHIASVLLKQGIKEAWQSIK